MTRSYISRVFRFAPSPNGYLHLGHGFSALLNRGGGEERITVEWTGIGYPAHLRAAVRDLWEHKNLDHAKGSFSASVPGHGVAMLLIRPE